MWDALLKTAKVYLLVMLPIAVIVLPAQPWSLMRADKDIHELYATYSSSPDELNRQFSIRMEQNETLRSVVHEALAWEGTEPSEQIEMSKAEYLLRCTMTSRYSAKWTALWATLFLPLVVAGTLSVKYIADVSRRMRMERVPSWIWLANESPPVPQTGNPALPEACGLPGPTTGSRL